MSMPAFEQRPVVLDGDRAFVLDRPRVRLSTGEQGELVYVTRDGWLGVRVDGERRIDEWQRHQVTGA